MFYGGAPRVWLLLCLCFLSGSSATIGGADSQLWYSRVYLENERVFDDAEFFVSTGMIFVTPLSYLVECGEV